MYPTNQQTAIVAYGVGPKGSPGAVTEADLNAAIDGLRDSVPTAGDTLRKLFELFASYAPLDGAALTNVTVPTQSAGNNSTKAASTGFVRQEVINVAAAILGVPPGALNTVEKLADAIGNDANFAATVAAAMALLAPLASPTFTGSPAAPTPAAGNKSTLLATTAFVAGFAREKLTANRTYYVRTDGNDSNNGLANTSGGAFLTIQKAIDTVLGLDLVTFNVVIQVGNGTYTAQTIIGAPFVGTGTVTIQGDNTTPANVIVSTTAAACFIVRGGARVVITGVELRTTTSGHCLQIQNQSTVTFASVRFGACAGAHAYVDSASKLSIAAPYSYSIVGSAGNHIQATLAGTIDVAGATATLTGTPAFSDAFINCDRNAVAQMHSMTISGSATGIRYKAARGGGIFVNGGGANYLPGNSAGTATAPGWYE